MEKIFQKFIMNTNKTIYKIALVAILTIFTPLTFSQSEGFFEDVIVTAEKRNESLQDLSQAVTALTSSEIETKGIETMVDLSSIVPGVTVAKNEGYKTVISIRGVGNETNQNAIAAPSVAFHMDGIFIASPFSLQTDFIGLERIEVLRGPQGTLFGQNSTGGAVNVITKKPSFDGTASASLTIGDYDLNKFTLAASEALSENVAFGFSFASTNREGFSTNIANGQDLDDANNISVRNDLFIDLDPSSSLRLFAQYTDVDRNGSAMKGLDDPTVGVRNLNQDTLSRLELTSTIIAGIYEKDLGFANLKVLASTQSDSISVDRDNDRHFYQDLSPSLPGVTTYAKAEFRPETSKVESETFEINLVSNEPLLDGKLDWTVGGFYMKHEIENHIREYIDGAGSGNPVDGVLRYICTEPFADPNDCYGTAPGSFAVYDAEFGFISDAFPERDSVSIFGQTTYSFSDDLRLISGFRWTEDKFNSHVENFLSVPNQIYDLDERDNAISGRVTFEYDVDSDTMIYFSQTRGFKPGGGNLTFGFTEAEDLVTKTAAYTTLYSTDAGSPTGTALAAGDPLITAAAQAAVAAPMVFRTFEKETLDSTEIGLKTDLFDGRARANIAIFDYSYEDLQVQGTDPDIFRGGVVNLPESEVQGLEIEFTGYLSDSLTLDANFAFLDSEITESFEYLDNVKAQQFGFSNILAEVTRFGLKEEVLGNELAKTPEFTTDLSLIYNTTLASGDVFSSALQYVYRGKFFQRIVNNPVQDVVDSYQVFNFTAGIDYSNGMGFDLIIRNVGDEDGMNSAMTDVFGVGATGIEYIPPRQIMTRISYDF